ncbi:hypothetical protein BWQ96_01169 [Gracilariopsis chorda]|uniref:Uncharacterized protein n=1 Tax=Gracilariopsis chorda TaxID=448386 RepID=A0A2V3J3K9_9FLOR|nr:hypothetical protein BWQ96_01169 [Gracilariopsis chorda]|eukprot:PXF49031.1 hypothetical protein BWQ96_01169 [Gracilariopsis chorda]
MGLSAVSLRRRSRPTKSSRPTTNIFRSLCSRETDATPPSVRRLRDLPALDMLESLASFSEPAPPNQLTDLVNHIASKPELLQSFINAGLSPSLDTPGSPRDRLPRTWVLAILVRHGPSSLRDAVAENPALIRAFADVFSTPPTKLDAALAAHAADVLRALLHEYPKQTASALFKTPLVTRLVQHISIQPAAELLPRFVGTRVFTSGYSPILPMHKRAIFMMADARVHHLLLARYQHAVHVLLQTKQGSATHAAATIEGCCNAMAAISMRAMCIPRKHEDSDERTDVTYASGLGLITASVYNDAKDYLNLLRNVQPLAELIRIAFEPDAAAIPDVFLPTMSLLCSLLRAMRKKKKSLFPSMRSAVAEVDTTLICALLVTIVPALERVLRTDAPIVGRTRLAIVDLVREACATVNESSLTKLLCANEHALVHCLLHLATKMNHNDLLMTRVSQAFGAVFARCKQLGLELLHHSEVLHFTVQFRNVPASWPLLQSFVCSTCFEEAMHSCGQHTHDVLIELEEFYDEHIKSQEDLGLQKVSDLKRSKLSAESTEIDVDALYGQSEDYGHEVFIRGLLHEVSGVHDDAPPSDNVVQHAAEAMHHAAEAFADRFSRGLHTRDR